MNPSPTLRLLVFGKTYTPRDVRAVCQVVDVLQSMSCSVQLSEPTGRALLAAGAEMDESRFWHAADPIDADFALSVGGDGTFLQAVEQVASRHVPIIGVNTGRLGFLADVRMEQLPEVISAVKNGHYTLASRTMITVLSDGEPLSGSPHALNDIAILKHADASMLTIHATLDDNELATYRSDGLVVSTPTGSTAYSLSNGGPIIMPDAEVLCLTPIAPHSLNMRPVVVPNTSRLTLQVESRTHSFLTAIDGRPVACDDHITLTLQRAPHHVEVVKTNNRSYLSTLRQKMMWGIDNRNDYDENED